MTEDGRDGSASSPDGLPSPDTSGGLSRPSGRALGALLAVGITLVAGFVRFYQLDAKSFWFDEVLTAHAARFDTVDELGAWVDKWIDHPPFQAVLTWLLRGFGGDEFTVRLPVAIAGTLAVLAIYALGATLFRPSVGLVAAALLATMTYAVWYSQEARPYAFVLLWTILQMLFAYRAAALDRARDWAALAAVSVLALYTSYLALATTAAIAGFIAIVALGRLTSRRENARTFSTRAVVSFGLIGVVYAIWIPHLLTFLSRPDLGLGRIDAAHSATLAEVGDLLQALSLGDVGVVTVMVVGGIALALDRSSERRLAAGLVGMWLVVGLGGLIVRTGEGVVTIWPRYFMYLLPAGALLVGVGADFIARAAAGGIGRAAGGAVGGPRRGTVSRVARWSVLAAIVVVLLAPAPAALAGLYATPKGDDYRAAAAWIAGVGERPAVVITGEHPDWLAEGVAHELWSAKVDAEVVEADVLDAAAFDALATAGRIVVATSWRPGDGAAPSAPAGWERGGVPGIEMIGSVAEGQGSGRALALAGLRWAPVASPGLARAIRLIEAVDQHVSEPGLLPRPAARSDGSGWTLPPGWDFDSSGNLRIVGHGPQLDATVDVPTAGLPPSLALTFDCQSQLEDGSLRVYVSMHASDQSWLAILPSGAGYTCRSGAGRRRGGFEIAIPAGTNHLTVRVRSDGAGRAEVGDLRLAAMPID